MDMPTPTPAPETARRPTREGLDIREVDTAEALAAAGLTHVRYDTGEEVPWVPGLFLLDVASGAVEGWVESSPDISTPWGEPDIPLSISPSNRFLDLDGVLYDRQTERAYRVHGGLEQWWGYGSSERLLVMAADGTGSVLLDADLAPVAEFQVPPGERFTSPTGGYILIREPQSIGTFHLVNLEDESNPRVHTWDLPWEPVSTRHGGRVYRIEVLDDLVAFVGRVGDSACRVTRYDLRGVMLSDKPVPCGFARDSGNATSLPRISPDGRLIAASTAQGLARFAYGTEPVGMVLSIFDAATGAEAVRILGVHPSWMLGEPYSRGNVWLADSSGIIVLTGEGRFVARITGTWAPAPGWASPDDPSRFFDYYWLPSVVTVGQQGAEQVAISFGPAEPTVYDSDPFFGHRETAGWGARSEALRVWTSYRYGSHFDEYYGKPPLAPIIELPPLGRSLLVKVVLVACLDVREEPSLDTPAVTCLPHGAIAEADDFVSFQQTWMHIRTEDGVEGWAHADYLRWHSDGVRLEE